MQPDVLTTYFTIRMHWREICCPFLRYASTYDHRTLKTRLPVRSALFKQRTGGLVVRWVTTSEYPLLYVFVIYPQMLHRPESAFLVERAHFVLIGARPSHPSLQSMTNCLKTTRQAQSRYAIAANLFSLRFSTDMF